MLAPRGDAVACGLEWAETRAYARNSARNVSGLLDIRYIHQKHATQQAAERAVNQNAMASRSTAEVPARACREVRMAGNALRPSYRPLNDHISRAKITVSMSETRLPDANGVS